MPQYHIKGVVLIQLVLSISIDKLCQNVTQMGNFGIDKLQLHTKDFRVKDANQNLFGFNRSIPQGGGELPYLLTDATGRQIQANKLIRNTNQANYTINRHGLLIQLNPSKRFHPYHLVSCGDKLNEAVRDIEKDMKAAGIQADIESMKLTRIDLTEQHQMMQPCFRYNDVFRLLKGKRCRNQKEYPTGYQFGNTQWQTVGYDKIQKLIDDKMQHTIEGERNLLRIENKFLKSAVIAKTFPFFTVSGLKKVSSQDLQDIYRQHLTKKVLNRHLVADQLYIDFDNEKQLMAEIIQMASSAYNAAATHLQTIGGFSYSDALLKFGGIEGYRKFIEEFYSRKTSYRVINQIQQNLALQARIEASRGQITVSSLLAEVQAKFAA